MKAIQITAIGRPVEDRDVPTPKLGPSDVLLRVKATGICHSDAHYQDGTSAAGPLPLTPGHEVAGIVESIGPEVVGPGAPAVRDRVAVHYLVTCGSCSHCLAGNEQFCASAEMIGKHRAGGYAELIAVPARNLVPVPQGVDLAHAAVAMCSTATSFHAVRRAGVQPGDTVAVIGAGGLGLSAVQLAMICGAGRVIAVDISAERLRRAAEYGAEIVDAAESEPIEALRGLAADGSDVVIDLVGAPSTVRQATKMAGFRGRVAVVGISDQPASVDTYRDIIGREVSVMGVSDHTKAELPAILQWLAQGRLDLAKVVTESVPLAADAVEAVLQRRRASGPGLRSVIRPMEE